MSCTFHHKQLLVMTKVSRNCGFVPLKRPLHQQRTTHRLRRLMRFSHRPDDSHCFSFLSRVQCIASSTFAPRFQDWTNQRRRNSGSPQESKSTPLSTSRCLSRAKIVLHHATQLGMTWEPCPRCAPRHRH